MRRRKHQHARRPDALPGSRVIVEADGRLRAVLIEEGRSRNGNVWTKAALEQIARLAEGIPVNLYDFSPDGSARKLSHWEFIRRSLPPAIARMLPERLRSAHVATVRNPTVEEAAGRARVVADLEVLPRRAGLVSRVLELAKRTLRSVGISIHVAEGGLDFEQLANGDRKPTVIRRLTGFDLVSQPSAGGRILPVLEALAGRRSTMKDWLARLLRLVPEERRAALEALVPEDDRDGIRSAKALLEHEDLAEAVIEALELDDFDEATLPSVLEAMVKVAPAEGGKPKGKKKPKVNPKGKKPAALARGAEEAEEDEEEPDDSVAEGDDDDLDEVVRRQRAQDAELRELRIAHGRARIATLVAEAKLPKAFGRLATRQLDAVLEAEGRLDEKKAKKVLKDLKTDLGRLDQAGTGLLEGADRPGRGPRVVEEWSSGERAEAPLEALIAGEPFGIIKDKDGKDVKVPAFRGIKQAYQIITGDAYMEGSAFIRSNRRPSQVLESVDWEHNPYMQLYLARTGSALEAAILTTGFPNILANIINKRMMREYAGLPHLWRLIATTTNVSDFKARSITRLGEYGNLPTVAQNANYADLTLPTEDEVTATIVKHGGLAPISWESVVNDDLRAFRMIPRKLARAAERTLNVAVWGKLLNNTNYDADGVAVFQAATHLNLTALAYSFANLEAARRAISRQKDTDDREAQAIQARRVFVGPLLYDQVYSDLFSDGRPTLINTDTNQAAGTARTITMQSERQANALRSKFGWELFEVHEFDNVALRDNDVIVAASVEDVEIMEVGFLNGQEVPEIFVQDLERVGSFFDADRITYKVRHVHDDGVVVDYRGLHLIQGP